jgi:hypothetical protein
VLSRKTVGAEFISKHHKIARRLGDEEGSSQAQVRASGWTCEKKRSESSWLIVRGGERFFSLKNKGASFLEKIF